MARRPLVDVVADGILDRIVDGELEVGAPLPSEADLGEQYEVSRVTVREALRTLAALRIIRVRSGVGSVVRPSSEWQPLEAVARYHSARGDDAAIAVQLLEVRRMLETGAAGLAAGRLGEEELAELADCVGRMEAASRAGDIEEFVIADLRFHEVILEGAGNVFLSRMFTPLTRILGERRAQTSRVPEIQRHAIAEHAHVLQALRGGDPEEARRAMDDHMQQTLRDLRRYLPA